MRESIQSLGTIINITLYDDPKQKYYDESFALVRKVHSLMSLEVPDSDLVRLNSSAGKGSPVDIDPMTMTVLQTAVEIANNSNGRFTPMIQPLVALWDIGGENPRVPSQEEIDAVLPLINLDYLKLYPSSNPSTQPDRAYITREGAGVDLGGIAKGYAADLVSDYLKSQGVKRAILDFGGNILTIGEKAPDTPWTIGVQRPDKARGQYLGTLPSVDSSVVTSGVYERFFVQDGVHYHHLLDPDTGYPYDNGVEGVVIVSDVSMIADGYSTAIFGLGVEKGLELANSLDKIEAIFITADRRVIPSDKIAGNFALMDSEYRMVEPGTGTAQ